MNEHIDSVDAIERLWSAGEVVPSPSAARDNVFSLIAQVRRLTQTRATDRNRLKHTRKALEKAQARQDAVRLIHAAEYDEDAEENICSECGWNWPCDTIQALGGE